MSNTEFPKFVSQTEYRGVSINQYEGFISYEGQIGSDVDSTDIYTYFQGNAPAGTTVEEVKQRIDRLAEGYLF